ncbi:Cfr10I/Bse634I family restriction endonuclease [Phormidium sp. LEGE 05292]|uniref:Cfr10I/Bse634I family restriction endonuclease n=1 Tax=[Phormidium] sp. LEGE 05292 TaxID=767427 RepID=UPI0018801EA2|nr:Cfr10I/Bse634I family restriction endonuclease [Phormidium sp. LEGE 05292]MBE9225513.1 Cfr10I/Bse634I family restriction endonuclease [Phormidium sp. LEGE 05292]
MVSDSEWFTQKSNGKVQINSIIIYRNLSTELVEKLDNNQSVNQIINWLKDRTIVAFRSNYGKNPEVGALNNAAGRWNEFIATSLLSEIIFDINQQNNSCSSIFSLPNSQLQSEGTDEVSSKFISLFNNEQFIDGNDLAKIAPFKDKIFLPSPDYIIVEMNNRNTFSSIQTLLKEQAKNPDSLALYNRFKGKLQATEVKAAVSLKTSNRPDRRYQPLFEAAMIKAMGYTLTQSWGYYMVASELTSADRTIFSTAVAPHGIVMEQNFKLVDGTYLYNKKQDLIPLLEDALRR